MAWEAIYTLVGNAKAEKEGSTAKDNKSESKIHSSTHVDLATAPLPSQVLSMAERFATLERSVDEIRVKYQEFRYEVSGHFTCL